MSPPQALPLLFEPFAHNGVTGPLLGRRTAHDDHSLGGKVLTTEEGLNEESELTLEEVVTLRRPAWTVPEHQDDTEFYFDGVHFWSQRPGWLHQITPPSKVPPDGWLHSVECSCAVCGPGTRLTA
jgi:hypothetical protein